jgi:protein SCO1/2
LILAGLATGVVIALATFPNARERLFPQPYPGVNVKTWGDASIGGPFALTDHTGRRATNTDFRGRILLVLFGATASPDLTPSALQVVATALAKLGPSADRFAPILITVDPERDTPGRLAAYLPGFSPRLVGLTGTPEEIENVLQAYRVAGRPQAGKVPAGDSAGTPPLIYVMGADGRYLMHLNPAAGADAIAASLARLK